MVVFSCLMRCQLCHKHDAAVNNLKLHQVSLLSVVQICVIKRGGALLHYGVMAYGHIHNSGDMHTGHNMAC